MLRLAAGRNGEPTAAIIDSRTLRSTPESGTRAGCGGAKRKRGSKLHMAVDTLGHLLALHVTPASVDDRAEVGRLAEAIQDATGETVTLAYVDQAYTGDKAAQAALARGFALHVVKLMTCPALVVRGECACLGASPATLADRLRRRRPEAEAAVRAPGAAV